MSEVDSSNRDPLTPLVSMADGLDVKFALELLHRACAEGVSLGESPRRTQRNGMVVSPRVKTGMRSIGASTVTVRPPGTDSPVHASVHFVPAGR